MPELVLIANVFQFASVMLRKLLAAAWLSAGLAIVLTCISASQANGDVGVILNESLDTSVARVTGSGHSAVYLSRVCADSPVKLRLCNPGEQGSVISNYTTLGEDEPWEWNVVPLSIYLYGVEDPRERPVFSSFKIKHVLEERYREKYLSGYCESKACRTSYKAEWREMVAATLSRSIYIFVTDTTLEQDREFIAQFNALPNKNHFNGATRNCADFTRHIVNSYFPHATNRDFINDFGMTTPKAVARSFDRYAQRHPETHLRILHFAQVPGTIKRSSEARSGTEQLYHSKKLLVPMVVFAPKELSVAAASYLFTGRFNTEHEFEKRPAPENDAALSGQSAAIAPRERAQLVGTADEWKTYRKAFDSTVENDIHNEVIRDRKELDRFFKRLDAAGTPYADESGALWMEVSENGQISRVGLSASNILALGSDPRVGYELLLARTNDVLKSPKHSRETMLEFKQDWALLRDASMTASSVSTRALPGKVTHATAMSGGDD